jgi:hypothetical protein
MLAMIALGALYAVMATRYTLPLRLAPVLLTSHSPLTRLLIGPLWTVVILPPLTVMLALFDNNFVRSCQLLLLYGAVVVLAEYQFTHFWLIAIRTGTVIMDAMGLVLSVTVQFALWAFVRVLVRWARAWRTLRRRPRPPFHPGPIFSMNATHPPPSAWTSKPGNNSGCRPCCRLCAERTARWWANLVSPKTDGSRCSCQGQAVSRRCNGFTSPTSIFGTQGRPWTPPIQRRCLSSLERP